MDKIYSDILHTYKDHASEGETHVYRLLLAPPDAHTGREQKTRISVRNADTLDTALAAAAAGQKTVLLNMANPDHPGGFPHLIGAQEEDLFRRTNLHKYLSHRLYPIHTKCILSERVHVSRKGLRDGYAPLESPAYADILSCAAVKNTSVGPRLSPADAHSMYRKICSILHIAAYHKYECVVLSAFGCGGFNCPPEHVSALFKRVLQSAAFENVFSDVIFAIWDEGHTKCNYAIFEKTFADAAG